MPKNSAIKKLMNMDIKEITVTYQYGSINKKYTINFIDSKAPEFDFAIVMYQVIKDGGMNLGLTASVLKALPYPLTIPKVNLKKGEYYANNA